MSGTLYLCATPIGNLQDVSLRLLEVLRSVDLIAAEDTRHSRKLLTHFDIHRPLTSLHEHNERQKAKELVDRLLGGQSIALVSDAGTPGVSDPGTLLVQEAIRAGVNVTAIPGPSAALVGLVLSGLDTSRFLFLGFPPRGKTERRTWLAELVELPFTLIFYEAPHRLRDFLADLSQRFGDRPAAVARELTKQYEQVQRGSVAELADIFQAAEPRGEFVILVAGCDRERQSGQPAPDWGQANAAVQQLIAQGIEPSAAIKQVAQDRQMSRRELYNRYHQTPPEA